MKLRKLKQFLSLFLIFCCFSTVNSLKCKCTQSSWKTTCEEGICEVSDGNGACLMLDHPVSGRHYACSQSPVKQSDCIEKVTKSGATVKVCSCDSSDYCNFKMWPTETADVINESETSHSSMRDGRRELQTVNNAKIILPSINLITTFLLLNLLNQFLRL